MDDIYRSLTYLNPLQEKIQKTIWENTKDKYNRDTSTTYYDCTNYYFEIEYNDEDKYELDCDGNIIKKKVLEKEVPKKIKDLILL